MRAKKQRKDKDSDWGAEKSESTALAAQKTFTKRGDSPMRARAMHKLKTKQIKPRKR